MSAPQSPPQIVPYRHGEHAAGLRACFVELQEYERALEPAMPPGERVADEYLARMLERCREWDGAVFVAIDDGAVAGFVSVWAQVPPEPDEPDRPYAFVSDVVVLERLRGRGIGRALLAAAERHARAGGAAVLRLDVMVGNAGARRLYEDEGFVPRRVEMAKPLR
ncbi:MAG TPA: GNAT family N-acetyltransferase [Candidatus Binatia bacterium]|jgi:ribosomal protein S18 acetylase RimI-like enzyme